MSHQERQDLLRKVPSISFLLEAEEVRDLLRLHPRERVVEALQMAAEEARKTILSTPPDLLAALWPLSPDHLVQRGKELLRQGLIPSLKRVVNGSGVILHTNLGRAPLGDEVLAALQQVAKGYCNLEMDLTSGERSERDSHVEELLVRLTRAESALVVNNDAAAVLLVLDTFAQGKEVIVSRGELIEIGGSFRLPEIMKKSRATLVEVGTTNRTYLSDYEQAITPETALLFKANTSNYKIIGFVHQVPVRDLAALSQKAGVPLCEDHGNGLLVSLSHLGGKELTACSEQGVLDSIHAGVDLVTFSGDKLLGGPQAGIIVGKSALVKKLKKNPLTRALRVDKLTLSCLEATLLMYWKGKWQDLPLYRILSTPMEIIERRARALSEEVKRRAKNAETGIGDSACTMGGGAMPDLTVPSKVVWVRPERISVDQLARSLRLHIPPVIGYLSHERWNCDLRTLFEEDLQEVIEAVTTALTMG